MQTNDIITAAELKALIAEHGAGHVSVDGSIPESYKDYKELDLDGTERFRVVICYGNPVEFHLVTESTGGEDTTEGGAYRHYDDFRAIITTGLTGRCEGFEWVA